MLLALSPLLPIPIRITNEPGLFSQALPFLTTLFGIFLGLAAEPWKALYMERRAAAKLKPILYRELVACLFNAEEFVARKPTDEEWQARLSSIPTFEAMDWYAANHFNLVLKVDPGRGLFNFERLLKERWAHFGKSLPDVMESTLLVLGDSGALDAKYLEKIKKAEQVERDRVSEALRVYSQSI